MKSGFNTVSVWFGMIMVVLTFCGALAFTFTDLMDDRLFGNKRISFIIILLAYSLYRGFRVYQMLQRNKYEE